MLICGVKVTHDAAVAVIDTDARRVLFSVEMEKVNNGPRYAKMPRPQESIAAVFEAEGIGLDVIDEWAVDGWKRDGGASTLGLALAGYHEFDVPDGEPPFSSLLAGVVHGVLPVAANKAVPYRSFTHMAGHVVGSYVTSPVARVGGVAYVVAWDGGQNPRMYRVSPRARNPVSFVGPLFEFYGIIYGIMGYYYGPYANTAAVAAAAEPGGEPYFGGYETPGKLMSYIALGHKSLGLIDHMHDVYRGLVARLQGDRLKYNQDGRFEHEFMRNIADRARLLGLDDASVLRSIHSFLGGMLVEGATRLAPHGAHLIFTGGSALNIKWNSALRACGHFSSVWVPPFPNDSGSALGVAACAAATLASTWTLDCSVYSGPPLAVSRGLKARAGAECSEAELAVIFARKPETVVAVLTGRAEVGPRALGHRSLMAAATLAPNKERLNAIKNREAFRPVAPICMRRYAHQFFTPGTEDPFMLFDHQVRPEVRDQVPAIVHLDGSARLQTLDEHDCPRVHAILERYHQLTHIPMLCNTSANYNGKGFFPDVESALRWDGADYVWSEGRLFTRKDLK